MDQHTITELASVLRRREEKITKGEMKLTLTRKLIDDLNSRFQVLPETTTSFLRRDSNLETPNDLRYLRAIFNRSATLKLISDEPRPPGATTDLTCFQNLRLLELKKVKPESLTGIRNLRTKLQYLICERSIDSLKEILEFCGGDHSPGFVWSELKEAIFRFNGFQELDASLELVPWLTVLDLSHNQLKEVDEAIRFLGNLKRLNLGYNALERVPEFSGQICSRLQILNLSNNFLESLEALSCLTNLLELDLSNNCIITHNRLFSLIHLSTLQSLDLQGNPLSHDPRHRFLTLAHLHPNISTVHFLLDGISLTATERNYLQTFETNTHHQEQFTRVKVERKRDEGNIRKVRDAVIEEETAEVVTRSPVSLTSSADHLETKRQIKELRAKFGESWLQQQSGYMVQDALGLERVPVSSSSPYQKDFLLHAAQVHVEDCETTASENFATASDSFFEEKGDETNVVSFYAGEGDNESSSTSDEEVDLGDGEESLFLARTHNDDEDLFLVLTKTRFSERDCITSKEKTFWPIQALTVCQIVNSEQDYVKLEFETLRRDKRLREYVLDDVEEMGRLVESLRSIISSRPPEQRVVKGYKCLKCEKRFEGNDDGEGEALMCPGCKSTAVIEDD